jgi:hypothetical protein
MYTCVILALSFASRFLQHKTHNKPTANDPQPRSNTQHQKSNNNNSNSNTNSSSTQSENQKAHAHTSAQHRRTSHTPHPDQAASPPLPDTTIANRRRASQARSPSIIPPQRKPPARDMFEVPSYLHAQQLRQRADRSTPA